MKRWLRAAIIASVCVAVTAGALYEYSSQVVRGWLRGEAFYDGRPTSYWRPRCDEWIARFDTPDKAARFTAPGCVVPMLGDEEIMSWVEMPMPARPATAWSRLMDRFRAEDDWIYDHWPPKVLFGHPGAEPVLEELVKEEPYRVVAERALRYAKEYRKRSTGDQ